LIVTLPIGCRVQGRSQNRFNKLGDVGGDAPRLVAGKELGRRAPSWLVLEIDLDQRPARWRALPLSLRESEVVGLVVRYVAWLNTQSNVFVGVVRAQRIEQTKSEDAPSLNLCRCHDVLPLSQHRGSTITQPPVPEDFLFINAAR
jgi:hypothetical protein